MYKVKMDGKYLYHPWDEELSLTEARLVQELNKNGMFDFVVPLTHPLADQSVCRKSVVEVLRFLTPGDEKVIYRGCCMGARAETDLGLSVETDGDLVFFQDSVLRPSNGRDGQSPGGEVSPAEYFRWLVERHNGQVDRSKQFVAGVVSIEGEAKVHDRDSYGTVREAFDGLLAEYGGWIRTRTVDGVSYVDYLAQGSGGTSGQGIRQGQNLVDITKYVKLDALATRLIPIGVTDNHGYPMDISSVNGGVDYIQDDAAVREFGIITKVVQFEGVLSPRELLEAGREHLQSVCGAGLTIELTAVDLADAGYEADTISVGDYVQCTAPIYRIGEQRMQVTKKETDLLNPANSKITLGSAPMTLTQKQVSDAIGILPMVHKAVAQAKSATGSAAQAEQVVNDVQASVGRLDEATGGIQVRLDALERLVGGMLPVRQAAVTDVLEETRASGVYWYGAQAGHAPDVSPGCVFVASAGEYTYRLALYGAFGTTHIAVNTCLGDAFGAWEIIR